MAFTPSAMSSLDENSIVEWHVDGWFKGTFCALAILSLFLSIPGFFEGSRISKLNGLLVCITLIAVFVRPTRMVYSVDACSGISYAYWVLNFISIGLLFSYFGTRLEKFKKYYYGLGTTMTIVHLSSLAGLEVYCPQGVVMDETFMTWTVYSGVSLLLTSLVTLYLLFKHLKPDTTYKQDSRMSRIDTLSRYALLSSAGFLALSSVFSFTPLISVRLLFLFSSVYASTTSHLAMLLYKSLHQETSTSTDTSTLGQSASQQPYTPQPVSQ